jgi:hypothetical protein
MVSLQIAKRQIYQQSRLTVNKLFFFCISSQNPKNRRVTHRFVDNSSDWR